MDIRRSKIMNIFIAYRNSHKLLFKISFNYTTTSSGSHHALYQIHLVVTISILLSEIVVIGYFNFLSVWSKYFSFLNSKTSVKRDTAQGHVGYGLHTWTTYPKVLRGAPTGSGRSISRLHAEAKRFYPGPWRFSFLSRRLPLRSAAGPCAQCAALF